MKRYCLLLSSDDNTVMAFFALFCAQFKRDFKKVANALKQKFKHSVISEVSEHDARWALKLKYTIYEIKTDGTIAEFPTQTIN